ncbi:MAG: hypothetical protein ACTHPD_04070 [Rhizomicrobium sp.]
MKVISKMSVAAAALLGAAFAGSTAAEARTDFGIFIGVPNAVNFDYNSGGYCDSYGCPDSYWDFPVWYGPVYWRGTWYRGPLYYRDDMGDRRVYWIAGGWHHDQWRGARPDWWYRGHYYAGPALGYDYYRGHGFRHNRDRYWRGDWGGRHDRDHDWRDNNRDHHDWNNGDRDRHGWNGNDRHDTDHDRHDGDWRGGGDRSNWNGNDRHDDRGGDRDRNRNDTNQNGSRNDNGSQRSGYDSGGKYNYGNGQVGGAPGWYQQHVNGGKTTTTASPGATFNAQTGKPAAPPPAAAGNTKPNGAKPSGNKPGDSNPPDDSKEHHHHDHQH